jgi:uncharacterized membrane protein
VALALIARYKAGAGGWEATATQAPREKTMRPSSPHFFPLALPFLVGLVVLVALVIAFLEVGVLGYAYEKVGVDRRYVSALLVLSLLGSYVNIPITELPAEHLVSGREVPFFGMRYVVPHVVDWPRTVIAVNVGGAVIPALLSAHLVMRNGIYAAALIGVSIVTAVVHALAYPVPGVGIAVPTFVPPVVAAALALVLAPRSAPALAYVAGTMGTLIGGDLTNLDKIRGLGAPVASIGGAGTFDGVFLTGIIAVLLA